MGRATVEPDPETCAAMIGVLRRAHAQELDVSDVIVRAGMEYDVGNSTLLATRQRVRTGMEYSFRHGFSASSQILASTSADRKCPGKGNNLMNDYRT